MALSQVALNVFYLFNGRKILCCPQTQTTHSSVTAARGRFQQWGCECIHICPSICSHAPYGIWGSCCMAMSVQRLQCAAGGWASLGFQLPAAPRSFWAVVARRGQSSVPGHWRGLCSVNPRQMEFGFCEEGTQWTQYCRGYRHLFFTFVLFRASLCCHVIKYIFHIKWFYGRAKSHFRGKQRNMLSSKGKAEAAITQTPLMGLELTGWSSSCLPCFLSSCSDLTGHLQELEVKILSHASFSSFKDQDTENSLKGAWEAT